MKPDKIEQISGEVLAVNWEDGKQCFYSAKLLRKNCPCAVCQEEKEHDNPLTVIKVYPKNLELLNWHWVGRYALSIQWSDGHDMGIYTFDYLRKLCNEEEEI